MAKNKAQKTEKKAKKVVGYGAEDIQVLEGLEPVRKRPGMYIGSTGVEGLHQLVWEIFDNARDEAMGGFADNVEVALLPNNRIRVVDNGRGIPVDIHKKTKVSALETIMTTLHAGGKFGGESYKFSGGLHGVGASVVNALSIYTKAEVHKEGNVYMQEYKQGKKKANVKKTGKTSFNGTIITFEPDSEIFKEIKFNWNQVVNHLRQQAYLVKGMRITIIDAREYEGEIDDSSVVYFKDLNLEVPSTTFYFEGGLMSLVKFYNQALKPIHKNIFYVDRELDEVGVEVALQYVDDISSRDMAFANNIYNAEGGMHVTGFKTALTRRLNDYARKNNLLKEKDENFTSDDVREGITVVVSVKMREIQFEGQTKVKLGSVEARGAVEKVFGEAFSEFLEEHPDDARSIINKVILALRARKAAKAAKDSVLRKGALEGMTLPGKLADCQSTKMEESEIFIVEGDSAGGCFSGDTKVALVDGRALSFKELAKEHKNGKKNYCYTIDDNGKVQVAHIVEPRITRHAAEVIKVELDNQESIICTPDHKFMLRDGGYKEARCLTQDDSLMPFHRKISKIEGRVTIKGYEMVLNPGTSWWSFTHVLADNYNVNEGVCPSKTTSEIVHHVDFNKRNNNPNNLVRMDKQEHFHFHTQNLDKTLHSEESKEKARRAHQSPEYRKKITEIMKTPEMRKILSARAKKQWENEEYKKYMMQKFKEFYCSNEEYRKENKERLNREQKEYWREKQNRKKQSQCIKYFFEKHPERKVVLSNLAKKQWADANLRAWRREKTEMQWTADFREKRKKTYNQTYLRKGLGVLYDIYREHGCVDFKRYNEIRKETNDKSLIKHNTLADRFFDGDVRKLREAVVNLNHRIKSIERVHEPIDVYDLEVSGTHNFALQSGVFVHNSSKQGRDRRTQAILPLRGKILNVERARLDKMLASKEIKALVVALGTAIGDTFDIEKLRYGKIIIATDADVDGAHIRTLLLTLFYRYFKPLVEAGNVFIAQPPLYKIKKGKEIAYVYTEEEKEKMIGKDMGDAIEEVEEEEEEGEEKKTKKVPKISLQRYKGLGEMNPEELWETTMDPERRVLKKVTIEDAQDADKTFDILMGTDVPSRKSFIQTNAKTANIDW